MGFDRISSQAGYPAFSNIRLIHSDIKKARPINKVLKQYGYKTKVPYGGAYRFHAVHKDVKTKYPKRYKKIVQAYKKTTRSNKDFIAFADKTKVGRSWLGPKKSNKLYRKVDKEFTDIMKNY